jgi:putative transposase
MPLRKQKLIDAGYCDILFGNFLGGRSLSLILFYFIILSQGHEKTRPLKAEMNRAKKMIEGSPFAKGIADVSWNQFLQILSYKAEEAGRKIGFVDPAYTMQDCFNCGHREKKDLCERMHDCQSCGYRASRDLNAAQNILALGLDGLGVIPRSLRL